MTLEITNRAGDHRAPRRNRSPPLRCAPRHQPTGCVPGFVWCRPRPPARDHRLGQRPPVGRNRAVSRSGSPDRRWPGLRRLGPGPGVLSLRSSISRNSMPLSRAWSRSDLGPPDRSMIAAFVELRPLKSIRPKTTTKSTGKKSAQNAVWRLRAIILRLAKVRASNVSPASRRQ